ncbi:hypothetical protein EDB83DRAFT_2527400 [Lactarius deliciosus]|nr:hypothetical protein EDB83DRAFT_2527400 [Lactarius deliciosus]
MNSNTTFALLQSNLFSARDYLPSTDPVSLVDAHATDSWKTHDSTPRSAPPVDVEQDFGIQIHFTFKNYAKNNDNPVPTLVDLADEVKGMYRLLDLVSESVGDGYGKDPSSRADGLTTLIRHIVDQVIVAQDTLQRFTLDRLAIKPLGIYGCKDEIVRLLQSLGAVDGNLARLLLAPSDGWWFQRPLSSGLYILKASAIRPNDERHYVIYWPEDLNIDPSIFVPRLLPGETAQALLTAVYIPHQVRTETMSQRPYTQEETVTVAVKRSNALVLSDDLDEDTVQTLVNIVLSDLFPEQCTQWRVMQQDIRDMFMREQTRNKSAVAQDIANTGGSLRCALREEVVDHVSTLFPSLDRDGLSPPVRVHGNSELEVESRDALDSLLSRYSSYFARLRASFRHSPVLPGIREHLQKHVTSAKFDGVLEKSLDFKTLELDVLTLWHLQEKHGHLRPETRSALGPGSPH